MYSLSVSEGFLFFRLLNTVKTKKWFESKIVIEFNFSLKSFKTSNFNFSTNILVATMLFPRNYILRLYLFIYLRLLSLLSQTIREATRRNENVFGNCFIALPQKTHKSAQMQINPRNSPHT